MISDVELNRAMNALSTTLRDQRSGSFDVERFQSPVDGSLGGQRKLVVRQFAGDRGPVVHRITASSACRSRRRARPTRGAGVPERYWALRGPVSPCSM